MTGKILDGIIDRYKCKVQKGHSLAPYTSFKIGGNADYILFPESKEGLVGICRELKENGVRFMVMGNGSNLLFSDDGYRGVVVVTTDMKNVSVDKNIVTAECGVSLTKLACIAQENSLTGFEFAYGIPGSVGGAVYMNAGAYVSEISAVLKSCTCFDTNTGEILTLDNAACDFSYRNSIFEKNGGRYVILDASFELSSGDKDAVRAQMNEFMAKRREKQPLEYPSAGSAFKRAPGYFTAKLIDDAGLKGYSIGKAQVSTKHAGFIINVGGATAQDVISLMKHIQKTVKEKFDVDIEGEIRIVE